MPMWSVICFIQVMFICNHCPFVIHLKEDIVKLAANYMPVKSLYKLVVILLFGFIYPFPLIALQFCVRSFTLSLPLTYSS